MSKQYVFILFAAVISIITVLSCKHEILNPNPPGGGGGTGGGGTGPTTPPCSTDTVYFTQQVLPILISNCSMSGCHDVASHQDGVVLTTYEKIMSTAEVRPGNPNDSELYEVLVENDPDDRMPYNRPPLPQDQIALIRKWIQQGAKNNSCVNACDTTNVTYTATIKTLIAGKCQGCHSGSAPQGGIDLSTHTGLKAKVTDGRLWGAINHASGFSPMPKNGNKLSDCEISQIRIWIDKGSPNN